MPEQWLSFAQDKWWLIIAAVVALMVVIGVVKTMLKWALVAAIVAAVVFYGANYKDELSAMSDSVLAGAKEQALQAFVEQAFNARYEAKDDGSFVVTTEQLKVEGAEGSDEVTVYWQGVEIGTFQVDATVEAFLNQAKQNGN